MDGGTYLHGDIDYCYAQIEGFRNPALKQYPFAVGGDPEQRHGIILARNPFAKRYGVTTGQAIWQAKQVCPKLVCVKPHHSWYELIADQYREILRCYSDYVEPYGIDEAWLWIKCTIEEGTRIAREIQRVVWDELGLTVSFGVSFNKCFAKLGSDLNKPNGIATITRDNYRNCIWPLPARELLFVGGRTAAKLALMNVFTIGDLANANEEILRSKLGIVGLMHKANAMGLDLTPVKPTDLTVPPKSIGNSSTAPHDIRDGNDAKIMLYNLAESVGYRLRACGYRSKCITVSARDTALVTTTHQSTLRYATSLTDEIVGAAFALFEHRYGCSYPYRSIGISCGSLVEDTEPQQLDFFGATAQREKKLVLARTVDALNDRFFSKIVALGVTMLDKEFFAVDGKSHRIHPVPMYTG